MASVTRQPRRNSYTSQRRSPDPAPQKKNSGNKKKSAEPKKRGRKKSRISLPSVSPQGFWRFVRWSAALAIIGLFMFGAAAGMLKVYHFCTTSDYFAITDIKVSGNSQVKTADILSVCGLEKGKNSLTVNVHDAEQALVKDPWIESAAIRRELPGSFTITVKERVPLFCARKNNALYYINAQGQIIAPVRSKNFRSLPVLEIGPGGEESLPVVADFVEQFKKAGFPFDISQISWIKVSAGGGFELYWESRRLRLGIGIENWKDNLRRIASVVSDIEKRKETVMVSSIRAADGQVWMTKKQEQ